MATDNETNEQLDFHQITAAMESRDPEAISRLMAAEGKENEVTEREGSEQEETKVSNETVETKDESSSEGEVEKKGEPKEAAAPAASTVPEIDLQQEIHRLKSELGRVGALQRTVQNLEKELRTAKAVTSSGNSNTETQVKVKEPELSDTLKQRIAALEKIDPDLAETMELMYKEAARSANTEAAQVRNEIFEREEENEATKFYSEQKSELYRLVPRHEEIFSMPEWQQWKDTLSPGYRALAESAHAHEVYQALQAFANVIQARQPVNTHTQSTASSGGGDPSQATNAGTDESKEIVEQRARRQSADASIKTATAKAQTPFDPDSYFNEMYASLGKANGVLK